MGSFLLLLGYKALCACVAGVKRIGQKPAAEEPRSMLADAVIVATGGLSFAKTCGSTDLAHRECS